MKWYEIANAYLARLIDHEGNIQAAADRVEDIKGTKDDFVKAAAYLALQVRALERMSDRDGSLFAQQIGTMVDDFRAAQERKKS